MSVDEASMTANNPAGGPACHNPRRPDICRACKIASRETSYKEGATTVMVPEPPGVAIIPRRDRAIVTIGFGVNVERILAITQPYMEAYARRINADFVLLDWPGHPRWPMSCKFGIHKVLEYYDRIAYVDADVLLRETSLNLFDACDDHEFGAVDNLPDLAISDQHNVKEEYLKFRRDNEFKDTPLPWYFNTGIMVIPKHAARLFRTPTFEMTASYHGEQHLFNARVLDAYLTQELKVSMLDRRCNWQMWHDFKFEAAPSEAILHWSGRSVDNRMDRLIHMMTSAKASVLLDTGWRPPPELGYGPDSVYADLRHVRFIHDDLMSGKFKKVLEIGSYHGFSTCAFLDALKNGKIQEFHICEILVQPRLLKAIAHYGLQDRVTIHQELSESLLARVRDWDLVFVDGDHTVNTVRRETELLLEMAPSVVYAHDTSAALFEPWCRWDSMLGPLELANMFREDGRYKCTEDAKVRRGERTQRGMFRAVLAEKVERRNEPVPFQPHPNIRPAISGFRISFVIATIGRSTLHRAIGSISSQTRAGDELLVVWDDTGDMAATPRSRGMAQATGDYLMFMDDDDRYTPGALDIVRQALSRDRDRVHIFSMTFDNTGVTIPVSYDVKKGNIATQMIVIPNKKEKLGKWGPHRIGDLKFIQSTLEHYPEGPIWHDEVIARWSGQRIIDPDVETETR